MIMQTYYRLFDSDFGWQLALWFSVVFNVNLALINLLPIPILDGGHIVLALIEGIRRRPINIRRTRGHPGRVCPSADRFHALRLVLRRARFALEFES